MEKIILGSWQAGSVGAGLVYTELFAALLDRT